MEKEPGILYELINPSDPYTFLAADPETAALTVFCFGTAYGAESTSDQVPVFLLSDPKEWYQEHFGRTPDEGLEAKKSEVIKALRSFVLGTEADRKRYEGAMDCITEPEKRIAFAEQWLDGRTSLNNIGQRAGRIADALELQEKNQRGES